MESPTQGSVPVQIGCPQLPHSNETRSEKLHRKSESLQKQTACFTVIEHASIILILIFQVATLLIHSEKVLDAIQGETFMSKHTLPQNMIYVQAWHSAGITAISVSKEIWHLKG